MEDEHGMIPMGGPDEVEGPDGPPTVKMRNAAQQEVADKYAEARAEGAGRRKRGDLAGRE